MACVQRKITYLLTYVPVPIDDVYVMAVSPYDDADYRVARHDELVLQQYEQWGVVCAASAPSFVAPNLTVDVTGRDVTPLFTPSVDRRPVLLESGLTRHRVTVRLRYVTSQPEPEMNGETLTCTAAGQPGFDDVSTTAVLVVNCTCCSISWLSTTPTPTPTRTSSRVSSPTRPTRAIS